MSQSSTILLLLASTFISCSSSLSVISSCNATLSPRITDYVYNYSSNSSMSHVLICPDSVRTSSDPFSWRYNFLTNGTVMSNKTFNSSEVCVRDNTLVISDSVFLKMEGFFTFSFTNEMVSITLDVRFAPNGIYLDNMADTVLFQNETVSLRFRVYTGPTTSSLRPKLKRIFSDGTIATILDLDSTITDPPFSLRTPTKDTTCQNANSDSFMTATPQVIIITLTNPDPNYTGTYIVSAIVPATGNGEDRLLPNLTFSINILPVSSPTPSNTTLDTPSIFIPPTSVTLKTSTIVDSTSTITSTMATPQNSSSPPVTVPSGSLIMYLLLVILGVALIAVAVIGFVLIGFCCYRYKFMHNATSRLSDVAAEQPPIENSLTTPGEDTKPLVRSNGSVSTPNASTAVADYTAVYCSDAYRQIGTLWVDKLGDKIHIVNGVDEIIQSLMDNHCLELYIYANLYDDISREIMSRGIPSGRDKLTWWQFVPADTKTPDHILETNGFHIIQVEGDPNDIDTHQLGILKTQYPPINSAVLKKREKFKSDEVDGRGGSHFVAPHTTQPPPYTGPTVTNSVTEELKITNTLLAKITGTLEESSKKLDTGNDISRQALRVNQELLNIQEMETVVEVNDSIV